MSGKCEGSIRSSGRAGDGVWEVDGVERESNWDGEGELQRWKSRAEFDRGVFVDYGPVPEFCADKYAKFLTNDYRKYNLDRHF